MLARMHILHALYVILRMLDQCGGEINVRAGPSIKLVMYFEGTFHKRHVRYVNHFISDSFHAGRELSNFYPVISYNNLLILQAPTFTSSLPPPLSHPFNNPLISATTPLTLGSLTAFSAFPSAAGKL